MKKISYFFLKKGEEFSVGVFRIHFLYKIFLIGCATSKEQERKLKVFKSIRVQNENKPKKRG